VKNLIKKIFFFCVACFPFFVFAQAELDPICLKKPKTIADLPSSKELAKNKPKPSINALEEKWRLVEGVPTGETIYYDICSVKEYGEHIDKSVMMKRFGGYVSLFKLINYKQPQKEDGRVFQSKIYNMQYNCIDKKIAINNFTVYKGQNAREFMGAGGMSSGITQYSDPPEDSGDRKIMGLVCKSYPNGITSAYLTSLSKPYTSIDLLICL
jgi:hypothetical protein